MFFTQFDKLCKSKGISTTAAGIKLGVSKTTVSYWRNNASVIPKQDVLIKIANYFGVSVDYLLNGTDETPSILLPQKKVRMIPLFESVSAGYGAYADSQVLEYVPMYIESDAEAEDTICVKVEGNSMSPKIEDGDIIQVRKQTSVDSGSIAVICVDGEDYLVKKVIYGNDWIELHSLNPAYKTRVFEKADVLRVRVVGLVTSITKKI